MCATAIPCPLCSKPHFDDLESLRIGLIRVATGSLACPVCQDVFIGLDKLTIHLFSHCNLLAKEEPKQQKQSPLFTMNALPFIGVPKSAPKRTKHRKILSEKCDTCGFYFLGKNILQVHKKLIHGDAQSEQAPSAKQTGNKHSCHVCSKTFKMRGSLMVHLRMVHSEAAKSLESQQTATSTDVRDGCDRVEVKVNDATDNNTNIVSNKQWKCDICQKHFTTKYFLKKHKRLHTGEMPYSCNQCNKTFTFQQSYHKHLLYHNDDKPHTCSYCGRSFKELSTLHNHQRIHTGEKPFSCESCGKCFRQRVSYLVHRRIHTGVMPYKCTACNKSFRYKVSQRTHKCSVQPPGFVVRQSGDLVQKLIKIQTETMTGDMATLDKQDHSDDAEETKKIIDELLKDSIEKIDFSSEPVPLNDNSVNLPSPSERFKSLKLSPDVDFREDFLENMIFDDIYNRTT